MGDNSAPPCSVSQIFLRYIFFRCFFLLSLQGELKSAAILKESPALLVNIHMDWQTLTQVDTWSRCRLLHGPWHSASTTAKSLISNPFTGCPKIITNKSFFGNTLYLRGQTWPQLPQESQGPGWRHWAQKPEVRNRFSDQCRHLGSNGDNHCGVMLGKPSDRDQKGAHSHHYFRNIFLRYF